MCRYAMKEYKGHFACFSCRKAFKKTSFSDYLSQKGHSSVLYSRGRFFQSKSERALWQKEREAKISELEAQYLEEVSKCPQCGEKMGAMGLDFRPPKQKEEEQWSILEALYQNGFAFEGCGCYVGYSPPEKLNQLPGWLVEHGRQPSEGEKLLDRILSKKI